MKIIDKKDIKFVEGWLVDGTGEVLNTYDLVDQANAYFDMVDLNEFVKANEEEINKVGTKVVFEPKNPYANELPKIADPATPTLDAQAEEAMKAWTEAVSVCHAEEANDMLANFGKLIEFVNSDYVMSDVVVCSKRFNADPTAIDTAGIVAAVQEFVENEELRNKVIVKR